MDVDERIKACRKSLEKAERKGKESIARSLQVKLNGLLVQRDGPSASSAKDPFRAKKGKAKRAREGLGTIAAKAPLTVRKLKTKRKLSVRGEEEKVTQSGSSSADPVQAASVPIAKQIAKRRKKRAAASVGKGPVAADQAGLAAVTNEGGLFSGELRLRAKGSTEKDSDDDGSDDGSTDSRKEAIRALLRAKASARESDDSDEGAEGVDVIKDWWKDPDLKQVVTAKNDVDSMKRMVADASGAVGEEEEDGDTEDEEEEEEDMGDEA